MLPQELIKLLSDVVSNQKGNYIRERNKDLEQLTYIMANQGLGKSSAFEKKKAEIYCQSVGKFAQAVWHDMQRVLEHGFDYYPGCEDDLIKFLEKSLADTFEWDANSLSKLNRFGPSQQMPYGLFDWHCKDATKKVLIEFKIFIRKFKPKHEPPKTNVSDMPVNVGVVNQIHVSGGSADESKKWSAQTWCAVIAVILTATGLIGGAIWKVYTLPKSAAAPPAIDVKYDTALAKDYDTRFENMTKWRALAAITIQEYLSKGKWSLVTNNTDALDAVLGFFDLMGYDQERGLLSPDTLHEYFCDDIMSYYQASQGYIADVQKKEGSTVYEHIKPLFETVRKIEAGKTPKIKIDEVYFTKDELWKYFQSETNSVNLKDVR